MMQRRIQICYFRPLRPAGLCDYLISGDEAVCSGDWHKPTLRGGFRN